MNPFEQFPGLRVSGIGDFRTFRGNVPDRGSWAFIGVAREFPDEGWDAFFPLVDEPGNDPTVFQAAVVFVLQAWRRGYSVCVACQQGRSRSVCVAAAATALQLGIPFASALETLRQVLKRGEPSPALKQLGEETTRALRGR